MKAVTVYPGIGDSVKRLNDNNDMAGYIMTVGDDSAETYKAMQSAEGCITINTDP